MAKKYQFQEVDLFLDKLVIKFPDNREEMQSFIDQVPVSGVVTDVKIIDEDERIWAFHFSGYKTFVEELAKTSTLTSKTQVIQ